MKLRLHSVSADAIKIVLKIYFVFKIMSGNYSAEWKLCLIFGSWQTYCNKVTVSWEMLLLSAVFCSPQSPAHRRVLLTVESCSPQSPTHGRVLLTVESCSPQSPTHGRVLLTVETCSPQSPAGGRIIDNLQIYSITDKLITWPICDKSW